MIAEAIVGGVTAIVVSATWGTLWLTDRMHRREEAAIGANDPASEARRVLERQRAWFFNANYPDGSPAKVERRKRILEIDEKLLELAKRGE